MLAVGGNENDRQPAPGLAERAQEFEPVEPRHIEVQHAGHDLGRTLQDRGERPLRVGEAVRPIALGLEIGREGAQEQRVVVDDQQFRRCGGGLSRHD